MTPLRVLSIAGTDSSGGAGITADVKTFQAHGAWGLVAVTAVTAQNTLGVKAWEGVASELVAAQIAAVAADIGVDGAKAGMLGTGEMVAAVSDAVTDASIAPLVVDPVLASGQGDQLSKEGVLDALRTRLLPVAALVTPNLDEAAALARASSVTDEDGMEAAGRAILELGPEAVLVTGGHLDSKTVADCLVTESGVDWFRSPRIVTRHTHGSGCVLSAALAVRLARGEPLRDAVEGARWFVASAIERGLDLGAGAGPVDPRRWGRQS
ncbi:MAG: bifunctional hydroxymethylpyrimidine kinase/phosphomethylpyrimidine kinase [Actinobacteria bacterium]|nr:bifunctional hydroxymethylpyrimidine kinase/phosphomethylpyrimidine kinase [Actinomycetota bacterium]